MAQSAPGLQATQELQETQGLQESPQDFVREEKANGSGMAADGLLDGLLGQEEATGPDLVAPARDAWAIGTELMDFYWRRAHAVRSYGQALLTCGDASDMIEANQRYMQQLLRDYGDEAETISKLQTDMIEHAMQPLQQQK